MKNLIGALVVIGMLSGCLIRTNNRGYRNEPRRSSSRASCPPSSHWDGNNCVHNGNGRGNGNGNGKVRDHRR